MPVINRIGDLLTDISVDVILAQNNLFHTMGAGIAAAIKAMYPEAYLADCATPHGDSAKLGTYSKAACKRADGSKVFVVNCYSQTGMGAYAGNTSYDAIYRIFADIEHKIARANSILKKNSKNPLVVGIPWKYGSGLAGGAFRIVDAIIREVFGKSPVEAHIIRLPSEPEITLD